MGDGQRRSPPGLGPRAPAGTRTTARTSSRSTVALAYVDLGHEDGVVVGSTLELHHVILAEHPVTGRKVRDTFPAGSLEVVKVGRKTWRRPGASEEALRRLTLADEVSLSSARTAWVDSVVAL